MSGKDVRKLATELNDAELNDLADMLDRAEVNVDEMDRAAALVPQDRFLRRWRKKIRGWGRKWGRRIKRWRNKYRKWKRRYQQIRAGWNVIKYFWG